MKIAAYSVRVAALVTTKICYAACSMSSYCSHVGHGLLKPSVKLIGDALQQAGEAHAVRQIFLQDHFLSDSYKLKPDILYAFHLHWEAVRETETNPS